MDANAVSELIDKIGGKLVASSSRDGFCEMVDTKDGELIDEMGKKHCSCSHSHWWRSLKYSLCDDK